MAMNAWKLTSAGRAALMDGDNRQTRAVVMRTVAIGSGHGQPSRTETEPRAALRNQRDTAAAGGQSTVAGRIAVRAAITPSANYDVTEVGLFAQIAAEAPFLLAYWTDNGRVLVPANKDSTTVIAGVLDLAVAAAEVNVTVSPVVSLSAIGAAVDLSDVPDAFVAGGYLRAASPDPTALENVSAAQVLDDLLTGLLSGEFPRVKVVDGQRRLTGVPQAEASRLPLVALDDGAAIDWGLAAAPNATVTLAGNRTMNTPTGAQDGAYYLLTVQQDPTGRRTLAWAADYVFTGIGFNGAPPLASRANERTKLAFVYEGGKMRCLGRVVKF